MATISDFVFTRVKQLDGCFFFVIYLGLEDQSLKKQLSLFFLPRYSSIIPYAGAEQATNHCLNKWWPTLLDINASFGLNEKFKVGNTFNFVSVSDGDRVVSGELGPAQSCATPCQVWGACPWGRTCYLQACSEAIPLPNQKGKHWLSIVENFFSTCGFRNVKPIHNSLRCRHNGRNGVSNHQLHDCLLNRLFRRRSKKTSKLRVTSLCAGNSPGTGAFPAQMASNAKNVSIWWRHHVNDSPSVFIPWIRRLAITFLSFLSYRFFEDIRKLSKTTEKNSLTTLIAKFMGPAWGPSGTDRTQVGPIMNFGIWTIFVCNWLSPSDRYILNVYNTFAAKVMILYGIIHHSGDACLIYMLSCKEQMDIPWKSLA